MRALPLLVLCSCTIIFNPDKAKTKGCPDSPAGCPALSNATASCADTSCQYSCVEHFVDGNADLQKAGSDGCELDCTSGQAPQNPASLTAVVGAASGQVDWSFPISATGVAKYKLCVAPPGAAEVCVNVDAASCTGGTCTQSTTGHADNVRVTGRVVSVDSCGREGTIPNLPTVSTTPLDTNDPSKWTHDPSCANSTYDVVGGQLSLDQQNNFCTSSLVTGDDQWADFTLDGDLRYGPSSGNAVGGLALHVSGTGFRMGAMVGQEVSGGSFMTSLTRRLQSNGGDQPVASSMHGATPMGTTHLRVIAHQGVISLLEGPNVSSLQEVLRFPDGLQKPGRVGIASLNQGRIEVTNFRVSTTSDLPPLGPTSAVLDFSDGGPPPFAKVTGTNVWFEACPPFDAGTGCDGGCLPASGSKCMHVQQPALGGNYLSFDLPIGLDVNTPWSVSLKFAVNPDAGATVYPQAIKSEQGTMLEAAAFNGWAANISGMGEDYGKVVAVGQWHDALWRFDPDAGTFDFRFDDTPVTLSSHLFPPANWSPHLGWFTLGAGSANNEFVTDVKVSQP